MYKTTYKEEWKTKLRTCVCSHMLHRASLSGSGVGGGLDQWVCSPATVGGHEWVD